MAKIDTLFMTKTAENPTLWGRTCLYSPIREYPPAPGLSIEFSSSRARQQTHPGSHLKRNPSKPTLRPLQIDSQPSTSVQICSWSCMKRASTINTNLKETLTKRWTMSASHANRWIFISKIISLSCFQVIHITSIPDYLNQFILTDGL